MVWLIVGSTGAGKTTYSKNVAKSFGAAVYSIDDWMRALYWQDMPANPSNQWFLENGKWYTDRIARCEEWILRNTLERESLGQNTILDFYIESIFEAPQASEGVEVRIVKVGD